MAELNNNEHQVPSLVGQASFSVLGVAAQGAARFATTVFVGRIAGADVLAAFSSALAITMIAALVFPTGLGFAISRALSHVDAKNRRAQLVRMAILMLTPAAIFLALGAACVQWLVEPTNSVIVASVFALTLSYSAYVVTRSIQFSLGLGCRAAVWDVAAATISISGVVVLAAADMTSWLLMPMTIGFTLCVLQAIGAEWRSGHTPLEPAVRTSLVRSATWNSVSVVSTNALVQIVMVVVFAAGESSAAGLFAAALAIATATTMVAQALAQALLPRITWWTSVDRLSGLRTSVKTLSAIAGLCIAGYLILVLLAEPILVLIYGKSFSEATGILQALSIGMCVFSIAVLASALLIAVGRERLVTVGSTVGFVLGSLLGGIIATTEGLIMAALIAIVLASTLSCLIICAGVVWAVRTPQSA